MKNLITVTAAVLMLALGASDVNAAAAAKAAPHYDCTKKGNANKAACKTAATPAPAAAAVAPAPAAPATPAKKPGLMSKLMHPAPKPATTPSPAAPAPAAPSATATAAPAGAHPVCKKGKPCGNSCIAVTKTCHKT